MLKTGGEPFTLCYIPLISLGLYIYIVCLSFIYLPPYMRLFLFYCSPKNHRNMPSFFIMLLSFCYLSLCRLFFYTLHEPESCFAWEILWWNLLLLYYILLYLWIEQEPILFCSLFINRLKVSWVLLYYLYAAAAMWASAWEKERRQREEALWVAVRSSRRERYAEATREFMRDRAWKYI